MSNVDDEIDELTIINILYGECGQSQIPEKYYDEYARSGLKAITTLIEQAKIEAQIEEREMIKHDICPPILANESRLSELTKQKEDLTNDK